MIPWCAALLLSAQVAVASAQASGADVVFLPGGGRLRGTVEVYEPGQRVVVLLPDGSRRTLAPGEFERVQFADDPAVGEAPPAAPAPETAPQADPIVPSQQQLDAIDRAAQPLEATAPQPMASVAVERSYGDGRADTIAWNESDPRLVPRPEGMVHFGLQLSALIGLYIGSSLTLELGGELAPYVDLRLAREFQLRVAGVVGVQGGLFGSYSQVGVFWMGIRPLLGFVVSPLIAIRIGGEIGFETVANPEAYGGGNFELAFRFLDQQQLELVFDLAVQVRGERFESWWSGATDWWLQSKPQPRLTIGLGYMF